MIWETERLFLRVLDESCAEVVLQYYSRNKEFLEPWESVKSDEFYTLEFQRGILRQEMESTQNGKALRLWIFKKSEPEKAIGVVGFNNIIRGAFDSCHLGYKLDQNEVNRGYISEAIRKGIEVMFNEYKLHRIEANIMPRNKASLRVVEKLGFYNEGLAYKYLKIAGKWEDHIHMVLRNEAME